MCCVGGGAILNIKNWQEPTNYYARHQETVGCNNPSNPSKIHLNTLRPRQNGRHFTDDIFKYIFLNENVSILTKVSLEFVPKGPINNTLALVQIMA